MNGYTLSIKASLPRLWRPATVIRFRFVVHHFGLSQPARPSQWQTRSYTPSPSLAKKGGKAAREEARATGRIPSTEDPSDFSLLNKSIEDAMSRLTAELDKLRPGGRFNPELLEAVTVSVGNGSGGQKHKLSSLAQVVPKGRTLTIFVEDKDHIKPITSAIFASNLNLAPQPAPDNPNNLIINLPPTTKESRDQAVATAQKAADTAENAIRSARQAQQKRLRQMQLDRKARPDNVKRAGDKMEKTIKDASAKVKTEVEKKKKVLSSA
ncbi:MAG: hypothetical protein M1821_008474 [Bathelium mastoideum]|nr:MAG: hypothetical protein M1821_008474 [Bathelium mastoideum]